MEHIDVIFPHLNAHFLNFSKKQQLNVLKVPAVRRVRVAEILKALAKTKIAHVSKVIAQKRLAFKL